MAEEKILILDLGSQVTQLIARRVREQRVYCEIVPFNTSPEIIHTMMPKGIILSGGPASVHAEQAPSVAPAILEMNIPVLGICYGKQLMCQLLGGKSIRCRKAGIWPCVYHYYTGLSLIWRYLEKRKFASGLDEPWR